MSGDNSKPWQELSGSTDWAGLLDPLNEDFRRYIIHYGEAAGAIGDAFNNEDASNAHGFSRYPMDELFPSVGLEWFQYNVTQFFYSCENNWIGYVAVATDEGKKKLGRRDILVVWRGTNRLIEAALDVEDNLVSAKEIFKNGHEDVMVHEGFLKVYKKDNKFNAYTKICAGEQVTNEVTKQVEKYKDEDISITVVGHSMGAALATLNAMDIVANGHNHPTDQPDKACQVTVFGFASPKVGNQKFKDLFDNLNKEKDLHALRIFNALDIVPNLPPVRYEHVGEQLVVDSRKSTHLKSLTDAQLEYLSIVHQIEVILHVVAGWNGFDKKFDIKDIRDYSLVNKNSDGLKTNYKVPASWWVVQNKGMVQNIQNGISKWALNDYKPPPPQF